MYFESQRLPDHFSSGIPLGTHVGRTTKNHQTLLWWKWMRQRLLWYFMLTRMTLLFVASTLSPTRFPHRSDLNYSSLDARDAQKLSWALKTIVEKKDRHQKHRQKKGSTKTKNAFWWIERWIVVWVCWLCTLDFLWSWSAIRGLDWKSQELNTNAGAKACFRLLIYMKRGYNRW